MRGQLHLRATTGKLEFGSPSSGDVCGFNEGPRTLDNGVLYLVRSRSAGAPGVSHWSSHTGLAFLSWKRKQYACSPSLRIVRRVKHWHEDFENYKAIDVITIIHCCLVRPPRLSQTSSLHLRIKTDRGL